MKITYHQNVSQINPHRLAVFLAFGVVAALGHGEAVALPAPVNLGSSSGFAVLAGSGITVTGPTVITGDIGTFPTTSITGFGNVVLIGVNHAGDAVTQLAKNDLVTAFNDAAGRIDTTFYAAPFDLGGSVLTSGVYQDESSFGLTGTLTLDAQGNPDAVWIFQAGSTLTTATASRVAFINGGQACNVFWEIGSSATLGTTTSFVGNILAKTSITLNTGATVDGRVLALDGAVTLDTNVITESDCLVVVPMPVPVPEAGTMLGMLAFGGGMLVWSGFRRRMASPA